MPQNRAQRRAAAAKAREATKTNLAGNGGGTGSNAGNILGFPPLTGPIAGSDGAGGYGMGLPDAKPATGQTPSVNPFIIPKGMGLNQITQTFPNYYYIDWDLTGWRDAANQCVLQGWPIRWAVLVTWVYQCSPFVQSLFGALDRALDQIPFFVVDKTGEQIPEMTKELCEKPWQLQLRREFLNSFFWGFVGLNYDPMHGKVYKYPMQNIDPINEMLRASTFDLGDGISFFDHDNLIFIQPSTSDESFLGMMQPIARAFIQMNTNDNNQVAVGRRLAFPVLTIGYPQDDAQVSGEITTNQYKIQAENIAKNLSVQEAVVIPYTRDPISGEMVTAIEVDFKAPGSSNGMSKIFTDFNDEKKNEIREMVFGGILTATTGKNGNRSLGDTQERKFDTVVNSMATFVLAVLNDQYLPKISKFYNGLPDGWQFDFDKSKKWTLLEIEALSNVLFQSGLRLTPAFFEEYGLSPDFIEPNPVPMPPPKGQNKEIMAAMYGTVSLGEKKKMMKQQAEEKEEIEMRMQAMENKIEEMELEDAEQIYIPVPRSYR